MENQSPAPATSPAPVVGPKKPMWPVAAIIIIGGIVLAIVYAVWRAGVDMPAPPVAPTNTPVTGAIASPSPVADDDAKAAQLAQTSDSTELGDIEADLNNTDLVGVDGEMDVMAQEVQ